MPETIQPALLKPILDALDKRGLAVDEILLETDIQRESILSNQGRLLISDFHRFIFQAAKTAKPPCFLWNLGWRLDHSNYILFSEHISHSKSLSELIPKILNSMERLALADTIELSIAGSDATIRAKSAYQTSSLTAQTDCFIAAMFTSLVACFAGEMWSPAEVVVEILALDSVPESSGLQFVKANTGYIFGLKFPSSWLLNEPLDFALTANPKHTHFYPGISDRKH